MTPELTPNRDELIGLLKNVLGMIERDEDFNPGLATWNEFYARSAKRLLRFFGADAAPDLLEAARLAALNFERSDAGGNFLGDDDHEAWGALNRAIAKATGAAE